MKRKISIYRPFVSNNDSYKLMSYLKDVPNIVKSSVGPYAKIKLISQSQNTNISLTNISKNLIKSFYNVTNMKVTFKNRKIVLFPPF